MASGDTNIWVGGDTAGPNDPTNDGNWALATAPADGEHVVVPAGIADGNQIGGGDLTVEAGSTNALLLASLTVEEGYDLTVGESDDYLMIDADQVFFAGTGEGYLDIANAERIVIAKAGTAAAAGQQMLYLKGPTNALLDIQAGSGEKIGLAGLAGETATFTTINISGGDVFIGEGVACTTLNIYGGVVENAADVATINVYGGVLDNVGDCSGTITLRGGVMYYRGAGTTPNVYVTGDGTLDMSLDTQARRFGTTEIHQGAGFRDPWATVTYTNEIQLRHCGVGDVTLDFGDHIKFKPQTIS